MSNSIHLKPSIPRQRSMTISDHHHSSTASASTPQNKMSATMFRTTAVQQRQPHDKSRSTVHRPVKWTVSRPLQPFPPYCVLQPCTCLRVYNLTPQQILDRIADFMRLESVECEFDEAEMKLDCRVECTLRFEVFLWQEEKPLQTKDTEEEAAAAAVIVEVQRRQGCCIGMQYVRRSLFRMIQTGRKCTMDSKPVARAIPDCVCSMFQQKQQEQQQRNTEIQSTEQHEKQPILMERSFEDDILQCQQLLTSRSKDQNRLGLESLLYLLMTDEKHWDELARAIVYNEFSYGPSLRQQLVRYFEVMAEDSGTMTLYTKTTDDDCFDDIMSTKLALKILARSLAILSQQSNQNNDNNIPSSGSQVDGAHTWSFWKVVYAGLFRNIKNSFHKPLEAALSVRCIALLYTARVAVKAPKGPVDLEDLIKAYTFGKVHHLALEQEAAQLMRFWIAQDS